MAKNSTCVLTKQSDAVLTITINRPEALNALNTEVLSELRDICTTLPSSKNIQVVHITGEGTKSFVAGADIASMAAASASEIQEYIELGTETFNLLAQAPMPVIAAVNGFALGGGLELALACDVIIAVASAKVGLPEVSLGVLPGFGGTQRLIQRVGLGAAKRLVLSGDMISAKEAHGLGVVDILCDSEDFESRLNDFTQSILQRGPLAVEAAKSVLNAHGSELLKQGLAAEKEAFIHLFASADRKEGMQAFLEKRKPVFNGS